MFTDAYFEVPKPLTDHTNTYSAVSSVGVFYVSDKTKHYCEDYSAQLKVTVS